MYKISAIYSVNGSQKTRETCNISRARDKYSEWPKQFIKPEDHWSCIAHLIAEDMLKSVVIEEKKFKNIECK